MIQVTKNVFVENRFPICNLGLVTTDQGIVMIDTPMFPSDAQKWKTEIDRLGELKFLINTEAHFDHSRNTWLFDGTLVSHRLTRDALEEQSSKRDALEATIKFVEENDPAGFTLMKEYRVRLADIAFEGDITLYLGGHTFTLIHLPGHTAGNIGVYIPEERVVFAADCVIYHGKTWLHEALPYQWIESLRKLKQLDIDLVIPGHTSDSVTCDKGYLDEQMSILSQWIQAVESSMKEGLSKKEASDQIVCPDPYPILGYAPFSETELNKTIIEHLYHVLGGREEPCS